MNTNGYVTAPDEADALEIQRKPQAIIVMGVSGSGKTTVGKALAESLACPFFDGDDYHTSQNIAKMSSGIPLSDEDRHAWLARLHDLIVAQLARGQMVVVACSALKHAYREQLRGGSPSVKFVYLHGDFSLIRQRILLRPDHYMKADMLQSQLDALEDPLPQEAIRVNAAAPIKEMLPAILAAL